MLSTLEPNALLRRLKAESAAVLHMSPEELDEADLHELEEKLNLEDRVIGLPMETVGGLPVSEIYRVESPAARGARQNTLSKFLARYRRK